LHETPSHIFISIAEKKNLGKTHLIINLISKKLNFKKLKIPPLLKNINKILYILLPKNILYK